MPKEFSSPDDRLYRLLIETVRDYAIFLLDPTGHVTTWNPGAERFNGWTADQVIGKHFSVFYPEADIIAGKPDMELVEAERAGRYEEEGWRLRKDGTRFWSNVVITALRDRQTGEIVGFGKVTRDLTERKNAEEALRESEQRFRLIVQSVRDYGIFMLDPKGIVGSWNEGAAAISGYTSEEIIGRHFSTFYPPADLAWDKPAVELTEALAHGRFEDEGVRVRKDGTEFWANVVITPLFDSDHKLLGYAKVTRDLTERRAAQDRAIDNARRVAAEEARRAGAEQRAAELAGLLEELRTQSAELERQRAEADAANRAKSEFLAAMSHELRTPLNAIGGFTELMALGLRGPVTAEQQVDLDRIRRSQQHLLGLINDILNYARVEAGQMQFDLRPVELSEIVDAIRPIAELQAQTRGLEFVLDCDDESLIVLADPVKVEQILLNLTSNASKFTERGAIRLECRRGGADALISVEDTGLGIPENKLVDAFEPFVQIGRSLTSTTEGTGLGLPISRDLARGMGGDLTATSEVGRGSRFTLSLPLAPV